MGRLESLLLTHFKGPYRCVLTSAKPQHRVYIFQYGLVPSRRPCLLVNYYKNPHAGRTDVMKLSELYRYRRIHQQARVESAALSHT